MDYNRHRMQLNYPYSHEDETASTIAHEMGHVMGLTHEVSNAAG
jgi:predicted Zn-dependent protease